MPRPDPDQPVPLSFQEEAFLRALSRAMVTVPRILDEDLERAQGMSLSEYFVLMHLSEAPDRQLSMGELADACALSVSGMTRIVNRLEDQDLVRRHRSATDRRSRTAALTDAGLQRLHQAWPTHLASVRHRVFAHLEEVDLPTITSAMEHFAEEAPAQDQ